MCGEVNENLKHFILWCPAYRNETQRNLRLQQPFKEEEEEEEEEIIGKFLFERENIEGNKDTLHKFWQVREKKMKEQ